MSTATTTANKVTAAVEKTSKRVTDLLTIKNLPAFDVTEATKPLFAVVGVADLAIEQVKDVPALYVTEAKKVQNRFAEVPAHVMTLPAQLKSLRGEVETSVEKATVKFTDLYSTLAVRGERLVTQIRRQPATETAIAEGKAAVKKAASAASAAKRTVKPAVKSAVKPVEKVTEKVTEVTASAADTSGDSNVTKIG